MQNVKFKSLDIYFQEINVDLVQVVDANHLNVASERGHRFHAGVNVHFAYADCHHSRPVPDSLVESENVRKGLGIADKAIERFFNWLEGYGPFKLPCEMARPPTVVSTNINGGTPPGGAKR